MRIACPARNVALCALAQREWAAGRSRAGSRSCASRRRRWTRSLRARSVTTSASSSASCTPAPRACAQHMKRLMTNAASRNTRLRFVGTRRRARGLCGARCATARDRTAPARATSGGPLRSMVRAVETHTGEPVRRRCPGAHTDGPPRPKALPALLTRLLCPPASSARPHPPSRPACILTLSPCSSALSRRPDR